MCIRDRVDSITADLVAALPAAETLVSAALPEGLVGVPAPLSGLVVAVAVAVGDTLRICLLYTSRCV